MSLEPRAARVPQIPVRPGTVVSVDWAGPMVTLTFGLPDGSSFQTALTRQASQRLREDLERAEGCVRKYKRGDYDVPLAEAVTIDRDVDALPRDWRAVHIAPGTRYIDEPSELMDPGWFVYGGLSDDPDEGAALVLAVEQALDRDETGMSLERAAKAVAARLNGVQS